jgi:large subunit ribosomal protein L10
VSEAKEQKKLVVDEIKAKIKQSKALVLVDYKGLTVKEDTTLRSNMRKNNIEYKVYKNRLVKLALNELGYKQFDNYLEGSNAVAFGIKDEISPSKVLNDAIKDFNKMTIKCGLVSGQFIDENGLKALSKLPPREVLVAKLLGQLQAPIAGLVNVLNGPVSSLCRTLSAVANKK